MSEEQVHGVVQSELQIRFPSLMREVSHEGETVLGLIHGYVFEGA